MTIYTKTLDKVVGVVTRLWADPSGVRNPARARDFSLLGSPDRHCGPATLLRGGRVVKFTTRLHLVLSLRMNGTIPLLPPLCL